LVYILEHALAKGWIGREEFKEWTIEQSKKKPEAPTKRGRTSKIKKSESNIKAGLPTITLLQMPVS
jgi:hypothetical protein